MTDGDRLRLARADIDLAGHERGRGRDDWSPRTIRRASDGPSPERERRTSASVPSNGTATVTVPTRPFRVMTDTSRVAANAGGLPTPKPSIADTETLLEV